MLRIYIKLIRIFAEIQQSDDAGSLTRLPVYIWRVVHEDHRTLWNQLDKRVKLQRLAEANKSPHDSVYEKLVTLLGFKGAFAFSSIAAYL